MGANHPNSHYRNLPKDKVRMEISYHFSCISYNMFKAAVLPIVTENPRLKHQLIYEDSRLPRDIRNSFKELETKIEREIYITTFIGIWMAAKTLVNVVRDKHLFAGTNLFDKYVLGITIPMMIFGYEYVADLVRMAPIFSVDELMFMNKKDLTLKLYRKRLVETYPDYVEYAYSDNRELLEFDEVTIFNKTPNIADSQEDSEEPMELTASQLEYLEQQRFLENNTGNSK